jgi:hypothetical protein
VSRDAPPAAFDAYEGVLRERLLTLRRLILEVAQAEQVGPLEETLKWGEPSFVTARNIGSTIRIDATGPDSYALYVNCRTSLMDTFRSLYPDAMTYVGDREIRFGVDDPLPEEMLRRCIALALTYHRWKAR